MSDDAPDFETDIDPTAIAIVGMASHLPGARNTRELWSNLTQGVESIRFWTDDELLAEGESPSAIRHPRYVKASAPLPEMELFDGEFFGFSPKESAILDPQHRHFLECAWEALEDAGHVPDTFDGPIGAFGGCGMGSYFYFNLCSNPDLVDSVGMFLLRHTGNDKDFLVTRVSHVLDLKGPSVNVQTACSTSLVAVHYAAQSLLNQECDLALAGGVTIEIPHRRGYMYKEGEVLSPDGHCHAFDHRAQGTVFGSGAGVVALRRLEDAVRDGDRIHAVIKSTAINNDGASKAGYLAPSVSGQAACVVEAHALADVDADSIGYVECHGTGTYLGDPIEISALTDAFRLSTDEKQFCRIGSLKTNIGHLDTAAGVASLIKTALILEKEEIPPSLGFEKPNPTIDFESSPFLVNTELTPWPRTDTPRRAGVQSLGVGGTNAHIILEEPPLRPESGKSHREVQLLTLSGRTKGALDGNTERLAAHLSAHPEQKLADVAYTLHHGRKAFERRRVVVSGGHEDAAELLGTKDRFRVHTHTALEDPSVAFVFPGGGAQYVGMGLDLYESEPLFREILDRGFAYLAKKDLDFDLKALLFAEPSDEAAAALEPLPRQLPAIFMCSYAMARVLESGPCGLEGIRADAFGGHSMGEYVAACLTGVFDFEEALGLVLLRGQLMDSTAEGAMLAVPLSEEETRKRLAGTDLDLAAINSPSLIGVSGTPEAIAAFEKKLASDEIEARRVDIDRAPHSRLFDPILPPFREYVSKMRLKAPDRPFASSMTGTWITAAEATDPEYWTQHIRQPVRFADAIGTLAEEDDRIIIEVGPGKALSSFAKQHPKVDVQTVLSSFRHRDEAVLDDDYLLEVVGRLWALGADVDLAKLWEGEKRHRVELPTYAFQRQHYFIDPGERREETVGLEKEADVTDWFWAPAWRPAAAPTMDTLAELPAQSWLVFLDDAGLGDRMVQQLKAAGHTTTLVRPGDTFAKMSDGSYVISPERGREGYDLMIQDLVKSGTVPSRVLHLWLTTADESHRPGSSFFHRNQERGFYSLLFLAQAIADENLPRPLQITVVTSDAQQVAGEGLAHPEKALVFGPALVTPRELPGVHVRTLDVRLPEVQKRLFGGKLAMALVDPFAGKKTVTAGLDALAESVLEEALAEPGSSVAALRGGKRYERTYRRRRLEPTTGDHRPLLRDEGVYLITGGLGGLGLVAAEEIANSVKSPTLVLVGRSGLPDAESWDAYIAEHGDTDPTSLKIARVRELGALGATVVVERADVTNVAQIRELFAKVRDAHGPIRGVVHTAGVVRDELLQVKSLSAIEEVFAPKVHGTMVLGELLAEAPHASDCDFAVLYSSTSTAIAPPGQVDYVAANAFLDAFAAQHRDADGPKLTSLHWGIWRDVGMAAEAFERTDLSAGPESLPETDGPFFQGRVRDAQGLTHLFAKLSPDSHWLLNEHRVRPIGDEGTGPALIPGTGIVDLITQGMRELGEGTDFTLKDLYFLRPLQIGDGETREVRLKARRSDEGYRVEVRSACVVEGRAAWQLHAQAEVSITDRTTAEPLDLGALRERCAKNVRMDEKGLRSPQEEHLRFGPRWRVLREERYGEGEAYGRLALQDEFAGDLKEGWALHPALLDLATGYAMGLIDGYRPTHVWVPVSYERIRVHAPLPREVFSWVRSAGSNTSTDDFALFDVTLTDGAGNVLLEVERFAIRRLEADAGFAMAKAPTRAEVEFDKAPEADPDRPLSPAEQRLQRNFERGIERTEGGDALLRVLARLRSKDPLPEIFATSLDLQGLIAQAGESLAEGTPSSAKFARPELDSDYVEPANDIERTLVGFWEELLGVDQVGVEDSFFDLGGHSLIAVRLFAMVKKAYKVEFPISVLFEAPTIRACAGLIEDAGVSAGSNGAAEAKPAAKAPPKRRFTHLVPMHPGEGGDRIPFFLVAGMFGNVLNLRHLAHLVGSDRPFYGLQARGLYGNEDPHETFEEAATDYLKEIRQVCPKGPYLLGGFSGGGYTALEMGRQLKAAGEEVGLLVMLDTPAALLPEPLSLKDRIAIQTQRLEQKGAGYLVEWASSRVEWEIGKLRKRFEEPEEAPNTEFHDEAIEAAFRRALARYEIPKWEGPIELFRPPLEEAYVLGPGRILNHDREYVYEDNGWSHYCDDVRVHVVPGDHDSMVLEPNVRVLASTLREILDGIDRNTPRASSARRASASPVNA